MACVVSLWQCVLIKKNTGWIDTPVTHKTESIYNKVDEGTVSTRNTNRNELNMFFKEDSWGKVVAVWKKINTKAMAQRNVKTAKLIIYRTWRKFFS